MNIPVGVSNRHVHLTKEVWTKIFGEEEIQIRNYLSQPGQFASTSKVNIKWNNKKIEGLRVVGPLRNYNQIELLPNDAQILEINPPRRQSGDLEDSLPITIEGPKGEVYLEKGVILAEAHIHMSPITAKTQELTNMEEVSIYKDNQKILNAKIKILENSFTELHIDKEESQKYNLKQGDNITFRK